MANEIAKAYVQIVPSAEGVGTSLTSIVGSAATTAGISGGTTLGNGILSNMKGILTGAAITAAVSGVVKALKACVDEASEFDASMSQVAATMGTSVNEISELSDFAKEMGRTTAFSANEAAEGLNTLALAGLDAEEQMAVLPNVMNLASAGCLDLDDAAAYVTGTIKGFSDSMDNAEYYTDLMAKGATLANTDVNDLGEALSGSAATAASYGQEADSVTLSLLRLAEQNVTGSDAATALNRAMADLYTPTDAAKQALDELGVSVYDETGSARDFNDVVDELSGALAGMSEEEQNAYKDTIFTTRGLQAFNKMTVSSSETVNEFKDALADCEGSAMQQAETQLDNLQGDVTLFQSAMSGLKIAVGEALTPALRGITQFATSAVTAFTDLITGQVDWKGNFCDCVDAVVEKFGVTDWPGLGNLFSDGIGNGIKTLVQTVPELMSNFWTTVDTFFTQTDWSALGRDVADKIIGGLGNIISDIPGVISNIASNIVTFLKETDWKQVGYDLMTTVLTGIKTIIVDVPKAIAEFVESIINKIKETDWLQVGKDIIQGIINGFTEIIPNAISSIGDFCSGIFSAVKDFFKTGSPSKLMEEQGEFVAEGLINGMEDMSTAADEPLAAVMETIDGFTTEATDTVTSAGENMNTGLGGWFSNTVKTISQPLSGALSTITGWGKDVTSSANDTGSGFISKVQGGFSNLVNTVTSPLQSAQSAITSWGSDSTASGGNSAKQFVTKISSGMSDLPNKVQAQLTNAETNITKWGSNIGTDATTAAKGFVSNIKSGLSNLSSTVSSALSSALSTASGYESKMTSEGTTLGQNLVQGMINGLNNKSGSLYSTITSIVNSAISKANSAAATGSPSKKMMWTGEMMDEGLALGLSNYAYKVDDAMGDVMSVMDAANGTNYNATVGTAYRNANAGNVINITQNIYSQAQTAAQLMREARHQAQRAVMQGV